MSVISRHSSQVHRQLKAPGRNRSFQAGWRGFDPRLPPQRLLDVTTHAMRGPPKGGLLLCRQVVHAADTAGALAAHALRSRATANAWQARGDVCTIEGRRIGSNLQPSDTEGTTPLTLIRTVRLTKRFARVTALDGLDLELKPGIIGLVGANGAGKSTLIKILLGLLQPTGGLAEVMGFDVFRQGPELRQFVGYMPEHDCLPTEVSATEFVAHMAQISGLPRAAARERTAETLRHVGLFEERYREMRGYSTGMKQRVKLAQALVHDPKLMLLDEPTNGLDPEGRDEMLHLIRRIGTEFGIAIILSSHLLSEIERVCDHLVEIENGRLVRSAAMTALTAPISVLAVEVDGDAGQLADRLREQGVAVNRSGRFLLVQKENDALLDVIRDSVVGLELGLVRLEQSRRRLEELFQTLPAGEEQEGFRV
jgi:ABC-2 type transport system ATP-binding protein